MRLVDDLRQDTRHAFRLLARAPGVAVTAILSLALGIGANTAIFSVVDTVLLRTLPVDRPYELVFVQSTGPSVTGGSPPYHWYARARSEAPAFSGLAAFATDELRIQVEGSVEQVFGQVVSGNYFTVLGVQPSAGRLLTPDDAKLDPPVAVIGHAYWKHRFGGASTAVGTTLSFGNRVYTIVGVTPPHFRGLQPDRPIDVTLPIAETAEQLADTENRWFEAVGRLHSWATVAQAASQADAIFQSFLADRERAGKARGRYNRVQLTSAAHGVEGLRSRFSTSLYTLAIVGLIVLLIACANLSNLLLARGTARAREFAIRLATGAGSGRLIRQLLTETMVLFVIGATLGLWLAWMAMSQLAGFFATGRRPILLDLRFDWRLAVFAGGLTLLAAVATGLWPARRALATDPQSAIKDTESRVTGSRRVTKTGRVLVAAQVALSLVLLVAAAMFVRTMANLRAVDLGFTADRVLTLSLDPDVRGGMAADARQQFWRQVLERIRAVPGVRAASLSVLTPLSGRDTTRLVSVRGFEPQTQDDRSIRVNHVSEDYFRTFGIELLEGRTFRAADAAGTRKVAIVNEAAAKAYFGGRSPLGKALDFGPAGAFEIVGLVRDHKHQTVRTEAARFAFVPVWQPVDRLSRITLSIASAESQATLAGHVSREVRAIHANTLVSDVIDVHDQIDATLMSERLLARLGAGFAAVALLIAAIGLYGVLSYSVAERQTELGVRVALGAGPVRVVWSVFRDVLVQVVAGIAIGLALARLATRLAEGLLFGVTPADPEVYVLSVTTLVVIACVAAWRPARRAATIDPAETLRRG